MSLGLGILGCGSVFAGPYGGMIERLRDRVHVAAVYDVDERKRRGAAAHYDVDPELAAPGAARRVTAMGGTAIPERVVNGRRIRVEADDNAHVLLDFGDSRFAVVTTGFTLQKYRSPAIEVYGDEGTIQLLGDDWAPDGWELWRNDEGAWYVHPESDPQWQWTDGLRHLLDCVESARPPVARP